MKAPKSEQAGGFGPPSLRPVEFQRTVNVDDGVIASNIESAIERSLPTLWDRPCVIVGGGPSLGNYEKDLKDLIGWVDAPDSLRPRHTKTVFALNNTHDWLIERRIVPDYCVIMDARPQNAEFIRKWHPKVTYLIASQAAPQVFDALKGANVKLWHVHSDAALSIVSKGTPMVTGAGTVISRATNIAHDMGYRQFHMFGCDSSYSDGAHHAYAQSLNDTESVQSYWMNGTEYRTTGAFAAQAQDYLVIARNLEGMGASFTFHCDGLLPDMWEVDKADRAKMSLHEREHDKYTRMWERGEYRTYSPGERCLDFALLKLGARGSIIDFGCGTGRATKAMAEKGLDVLGVDFVSGALDEDVVGAFRFCHANLWMLPENVSADYGYCCDVMEHIPTDKVDDVLENIKRATRKSVFFRIEFTPDVMGRLIGEKLHLTVRPKDWWLAKLKEHWSGIEDLGQGRFIAKETK